MILMINTSQDIYQFGLYWPDIRFKKFAAKRDEKKDALFLIDKFLSHHQKSARDLKAIAVYNGPGSYTGVRVGVTIANALSFSLNIPVFGFKHKITSDKLVKEILKKLQNHQFKMGEYIKIKYLKKNEARLPRLSKKNTKYKN